MIHKLASIILYGLFLTGMFFGVLWLFFAVIGCAENGPVPGGIRATGNSISRATAHVGSADDAVVRALPDTSPAGKAMLGVAQNEHGKALADLDKAQGEVSQAESDFDIEHACRISADKEVAALKNSIGHRVQVWVTWGFWIVMGLLAFHYIGGFVGAFLTGPFGIGLRWAAAFVNPMAWGQKLIDGLHVKVKAAA